MFALLSSPEKKMRGNAANWLQLGERVLHYRRDQLSESQIGELRQKTEDLRERIRRKADLNKLKFGIEALEEVLRRVGGRHYPKSSLVENIEFFLVATILLFGIRTYIFQPFKIPTNSMWPSYFGMTAEVYSPAEEIPGPVARAARLVFLGARHHSVEADRSGEIRIPFFFNGGNPSVLFEPVPARRFFVFPSQAWQYVLLVGDQPVPVRVPAEFRMDRVLQEAFFPEAESLGDALRAAIRERRVEEAWIGGERVLLLATGRSVNRGERVIAFDVLTGDQLFVDRLSYHFVKPQVGQGFVFRTGEIPGLDDKYYIKRLVGLPGDTLAIREPVLYRNGEPISGADAFEKNAQREDRYPGYVYGGLLAPGETLTVPDDSFFVLGDNSPESADGRTWGFVPESEVIGRPVFIYYPFTRRWGPAD